LASDISPSEQLDLSRITSAESDVRAGDNMGGPLLQGGSRTPKSGLCGAQ
jgi:hypothetical protein